MGFTGKIELIYPLYKEMRMEKGRRIPQLTLPLVAALCPPEIEVKITDEEVEEIDFNLGRGSVAGVSMMTAQAKRGYEIAREFRKKGVITIAGGIHPSSLPDEAAAHFDSVVVGEAECVWDSVITDLKRGELKKIYRSEEFFHLRNLPSPKYDLVKNKMFYTPVQASRGCPYRCTFCSVTKFYGPKFRSRPVDEIITEIKLSGDKYFFFVDDNIVGNPKFAKELFTKLIPLKIKWGGQAILGFAQDRELVELAGQSGCLGLFIGIESVNRKSIKQANKKCNKVEDYAALIKQIHRAGIHIIAGTVFGFDTDDKNIFEQMLDFYKKNKIAYANFSILTPFPGTILYEQMEKEGRIFEKDWSKYDCGSVVFHPLKMSPEELQAGSDWVGREFFKPAEILRRFWENRSHPFLYLSGNIGYRRKHNTHEPGRNVAIRKS